MAPSRGIARWTLHAATLAYLGALVLAALHDLRVPVARDLGRPVARAFGTLTLSPGMPVFSGFTRDGFRRLEHCIEVVGTQPDGTRQVLYKPPCPRPAPRLVKSAMTEFMRHASLPAKEDRLLGANALSPEERLRVKALRPFLAIGDFFCRSPLAGSGDFAIVTLYKQTLRLDYASGQRSDVPTLACVWDCDSPDHRDFQCRPAPRRDWTRHPTREYGS